jgi:DNA polymerase III sliding clamp (beta) subunit (PCNA family)
MESTNLIRLSKQHPNHAGLYWVNKARTDNTDTRYALKYIKVDNDQAIATDGHRMHIYKLDTVIPDGHYEVVTCNKKEITLLRTDDEITFPDYKRVIPESGNGKVVHINGYPDKIAQSYTTLVRAMEKNTVNYQYYTDIASAGIEWKAEIQNTTGYEPIKLTSENGDYLAVVMPIRMD